VGLPPWYSRSNHPPATGKAKGKVKGLGRQTGGKNNKGWEKRGNKGR